MTRLNIFTLKSLELWMEVGNRFSCAGWMTNNFLGELSWGLSFALVYLWTIALLYKWNKQNYFWFGEVSIGIEEDHWQLQEVIFSPKIGNWVSFSMDPLLMKWWVYLTYLDMLEVFSRDELQCYSFIIAHCYKISIINIDTQISSGLQMLLFGFVNVNNWRTDCGVNSIVIVF